MLHGTGQTAQIILSSTTWNHAAEGSSSSRCNPQALPYLLLDGTTESEVASPTKVADHVVDPSELPMADDVVFLRELHNTLGNALNIDCDRIYASGFLQRRRLPSRRRSHVDLGDVFAATTSSGGIGSPPACLRISTPTNGLMFRPHFEVVGTDGRQEASDLRRGRRSPPRRSCSPRHIARRHR